MCAGSDSSSDSGDRNASKSVSAAGGLSALFTSSEDDDDHTSATAEDQTSTAAEDQTSTTAQDQTSTTAAECNSCLTPGAVKSLFMYARTISLPVTCQVIFVDTVGRPAATKPGQNMHRMVISDGIYNACSCLNVCVSCVCLVNVVHVQCVICTTLLSCR